MFRFKTGTPARVDKKSIDFSKMEEQFGDSQVVPFSFSTDPDEIQKEQVSCWLTYTNEDTHRIIKDNLCLLYTSFRCRIFIPQYLELYDSFQKYG